MGGANSAAAVGGKVRVMAKRVFGMKIYDFLRTRNFKLLRQIKRIQYIIVTFLKFVISLVLVPGIKKPDALLVVPTNYVILKMAPLPYIIGVLYNNGAVNCTVQSSYVI